MSKIPDRESRLMRIDGQIIQKQLYAQYWLAMARPEAAAIRTTQGCENGKAWGDMSLEWKVKDALSTALQHIHQIDQLIEAKIAIFNDDPDALNQICNR